MIPIALKVLKVTWPYLIAAAIAGAFVGWVQEVRVDAVKAKLTVKQQELTTCQDANDTNVATLSSLRSERDSALKGCEMRIRRKEKVLSNIRKIDRIEIKRGEVNEKDNPNGSDPLLGLLNGMLNSETDSKD